MLSDLIDNIIKIDIEEIFNYPFPLDEPFGLEILHNGNIYDFIIRLSSGNDNLICFGSGHNGRNMKNHQNELIKPPFLNRWSWYKYYDESVIAYADPTFFRDEKITLGWYVGGHEWYLKIISQIIQGICENRNIQQNNILFYGSSGGGFASIALATLMPESKALVNNSSFNIFDITEQHYINLINFLEKEFNLPENEIIEKIKYRIDLNELFLRECYVPQLDIYVNSSSPLDVNNRVNPFLKKLFKNPYFKNNLNIHSYFDPDASNEGHNSRIHNNEIKIINFFVKSNLYNGNVEDVDSYLKILDQLEIQEDQLKVLKDENNFFRENLRNDDLVYQLDNQDKLTKIKEETNLLSNLNIENWKSYGDNVVKLSDNVILGENSLELKRGAEKNSFIFYDIACDGNKGDSYSFEVKSFAPRGTPRIRLLALNEKKVIITDSNEINGSPFSKKIQHLSLDITLEGDISYLRIVLVSGFTFDEISFFNEFYLNKKGN